MPHLALVPPKTSRTYAAGPSLGRLVVLRGYIFLDTNNISVCINIDDVQTDQGIFHPKASRRSPPSMKKAWPFRTHFFYTSSSYFNAFGIFSVFRSERYNRVISVNSMNNAILSKRWLISRWCSLSRISCEPFFQFH